MQPLDDRAHRAKLPPKEKGRYINASLPQCQYIDAALNIVDETLGKTGKK
jgi:hypothetical protein